MLKTLISFKFHHFPNTLSCSLHLYMLMCGSPSMVLKTTGWFNHEPANNPAWLCWKTGNLIKSGKNQKPEIQWVNWELRTGLVKLVMDLKMQPSSSIFSENGCGRSRGWWCNTSRSSPLKIWKFYLVGSG